MNSTLIPFILSTLAGLSTLLGSLLSFIDIKNREEFISFSLSFSLSTMISVSVLDLIPESIKSLNIYYDYYTIIIIVLGVIYLVNRLFRIIKKKSPLLKNNSLYRVGVVSTIVLMLHNFPEGIATFIASYNNIKSGIRLCVSIALHNIPEGISISVPTYYSTGSRKRGVMYSLVAGVSEPIGAIIAYIILKPYSSQLVLSIVLLIVGAIMINLAIEEIYPESIKHNNNKYNNIGLIIGLLLVIISLIII